MMLLLAVVFGGGKSLAQTATLSFTKACGGSGTDNKGGAWTVTSDAKESTFDAKGIHYGTKNAEVSYLKASTSAYSSKIITKIVVNASAANSGSPKVSCTVGGEDFGTQKSLATDNAAYTFEGSASGDIVVSITKTKSTKALYLKSVEVTYGEDGKTTTSISFPQSSYTFDLGSGLHDFANTAVLSPAEAGTVVYSVDKDWVEIENGYVVVQTDEVGTATVTATFAGNDSYTESSASYTISVVKPLEDGVFDFTGSQTYGSGLTQTGSDYYKTPIVFTAGKVTVTTKTTSGSGFRWWTNTTDKTNELRFYTGTTFTVSVPDGYVI